MITLKQVWYHCGGCDGNCADGIGPIYAEIEVEVAPEEGASR